MTEKQPSLPPCNGADLRGERIRRCAQEVGHIGPCFPEGGNPTRLSAPAVTQ